MFVYKIVNSVNDRIYVGITTCSLQKRWREHRCAANTDINKPLYRAMRKYGIDKFSMHLIYTATSLEDLREAELRFIKDLGAHALEHGYNLTDHGISFGRLNQPLGENVANSKLNEEIIAFIRAPENWNVSNAQMLYMVENKFGIQSVRDTIRDARRGDTWKHLDIKYPPIKVGQGARKPPKTEEQKAKAREVLKKYHAEAVCKSAELRKGKRGLNATLSEQTVKDIFYSALSQGKTAAKFGVSKPTVRRIKQRKAHNYLTKDL